MTGDVVELSSGPWLASVAWLTSAEAEAVVVPGDRPGKHHRTVGFNADGTVQIHTDVTGLDVREADLRVASRLPRPRSLARATLCAGIVGHALIDAEPGLGKLPPGDGLLRSGPIGIATASTSAASEIALRFETRGLREGWHLVDPLLLPNTIASALASQVGLGLGLDGFATAYTHGSVGFLTALADAALALVDETAEAALVIGAEEVTDLQRAAMTALSIRAAVVEGGAGVLLRCWGRGAGWRVGLLGQGNGPVRLPSTWADALVTTWTATADEPMLDALVPPLAIAAALARARRRFAVIARSRTLGWRLAGFERAT